MPSRFRLLLGANCLFALTACQYQTSPTLDGQLVHWSPMVRFAAWALPIAGLVSGALLVRWGRFVGTGAALIGLAVLGTAVSAAVLADQITFNDRGVSDRHGFPWNRKDRGFALEGLQRVWISEERVGFGPRASRQTRWHFDYGDSRPVVVLTTGSLWNTAREEILAYLSMAGVELGPDLSTFLPSHVGPSGGFPNWTQGQPTGPALDAPTGKERIQALWSSGAWREFRSPHHAASLPEAGLDLAGTWQTQRTVRGQRLTLRLQLRADGTLTYTVLGKAQSLECEGTWSRTDREWTMGTDGSRWSVLL